MNNRGKWQLAVVLALLLSSLMWDFSLRAAGQREKQLSSRDNVEETSGGAADQVSSLPRNTGYRSPTERHKVQITDKALASQIKGKLVGDYKSYQIYEVDTATLNQLKAEESVELRDEYNVVMLNAGQIDTTTKEAQALRKAESISAQSVDESRLHLIQFAGPIQDSWLKQLRATGVEIIDYIPSNAYLVYGNASAISRVRALASKPFVQWDAPYLDEYAIQPSVTEQLQMMEKMKASGIVPQAAPDDLYDVQLVADPKNNPTTINLINSLKTEASIRRQDSYLKYVVVLAKLPTANLKQIASRPDVIAINRYVIPEKLDERQNMIISGQITGNLPNPGDYMAWLTALGFNVNTSSTFGVDVTDSGVDNATPASPNHFALRVQGNLSLASRLVYARLEGTPNTGSTIQGCDGHGNLNAHIVGGHTGSRNASPHADSSGFRYGLGVAPFALLGSSVIFDPNNFTFPDYEDLQSRAYNDNMRISTNSWGAAVGGAYNTDAQRYDALVRDAQPSGSAIPVAGNQEMVMLFAAGNSGSGANTTGSPGTAKNVITVGASENVHPFGGADQCGIADTGADSANDIISFSSRGPCDDGRRKPEIVGPGTHVTGGVFQATASDAGTGAAAACFNASGVCAGPGGSDFFPVGQQFYTASSGTSHSTPAAAGIAALLRQFHINNGLPLPSPAFTKAAMMVAARYMTGTGANDTLWSNSQGMGLMDSSRMFDTVPKVRRDQTITFGATGDSHTITGNVATPSQPFRVTLAWTDPPGSITGNAFVNNLDLEVTVGGNTYRGNVFSGPNSVTGGTADLANNAESVFVPAGVTGPFTVTVRATNIAGDGVPGNVDLTDQDFALIIYNANEVAQPVITSAGLTLVSESCTPPNSAPDPGETLTYNLALQNVGTLNTPSDVIATLQPTGGVTAPSGAQNYGILIAGGPAVTRPFTFTVDPGVLCGNTITLTFTLSGGATGNITVMLQTGTLAVSFAENFDSVTAPTLPAGWVATRPVGTVALWATVNSSSDTAPNSIFTNDPSTVADNRIDTPVFFVSSATAQMTFRHRYGLETGFDGGVLEISIGGGPFTDILAAGGSFVSGGYTGTISTFFSNPIGGRQAWTGTLSIFSTVTVNLPAAAAGQNVQLRFRMGSDSSVFGTGWFVDTIQVLGGFVCTSPCSGGGATLEHQSVYVADTNNNRIQRSTDDGATWEQIGLGSGVTLGRFTKPRGVAASGDDQIIFVADTGNNRIQRSTDGGATWSLLNTGPGPSTIVGRINGAQGIAYDEVNDILYVADTGNNRIQSVTGASTGSPAWALMTGTGFGSALGKFNQPRGIAVDLTGNVYVADTGNNRIQFYDGSVWSIFASATFGSAVGKVNGPRGIFVNDDGVVYVADTNNNRIQFYNGAWAVFNSSASSKPEGVTQNSNDFVFFSHTALNTMMRRPADMSAAATIVGPSGTLIGRFQGPTGVR